METTNRLLPRDIEEELKQSFIAYSMSVIINRALPDVRDGLKPVHRRILYSMHEMGMTPDKPYKKSARIVGDVLGKYHPHGDTAVYDAMVRMAQHFSQRYMLVEGQGNFGSVDGDGAAAMRYTEARLSKIATEMLTDLDKETVDFDPNFDGSLVQPKVLPSRFPNLLVNGSGGIAVGMATNIPPHNLTEVINGVVHMIDDPDCSTQDLMQHIKGPDFPTGATIMGDRGIREAFMTGRGRVVTRAKTEIEPMDNGKNRIVVTEIPYQVNKARLVEKIAELVQEKRIEGIADLRDESDRAGMRIVIELKRDVVPQIVLNLLYKHTQMQETFGVIMLALVDGHPRVLNLKQMIYYYLEHQKEIIVRRTRYELSKAEARAHVLEGLLIALDHIDEVIALIRASQTADIARDGLMERFALTKMQANAILDMRLQRLTGLEREKLQAEYEELQVTIERLRAILANEQMVMDIVREELLQIRDRYGDARRTEITMDYNDIDIEDMIQQEDMVVTLTHFGYIKRLPADTYRSQHRGGKGITGLSTREEDFVEQIFVTSTHAELMFFTNQGRVYRLKCYELPEVGRQARGTAIVNLLQLEGGEKVTAVIPLEDAEGKYLTMATRRGVIKKTPISDFVNLRSRGLIAIVLRENDELIGVSLTDGEHELLIGTRQGMVIRFPESNIRPLGRATQGVKSIDLGETDEVVAVAPIPDEDQQVLVISENGYGKRSDLSEYRLQSRGGKGIKAMNLTDKTGLLTGQLLVQETDDIMIISDDGTVIRLPVAEISSLSRNTQGVRLMRLPEGSKVVCIARTTAQEETEDIASQSLQARATTSSRHAFLSALMLVLNRASEHF